MLTTFCLFQLSRFHDVQGISLNILCTFIQVLYPREPILPCNQYYYDLEVETWKVKMNRKKYLVLRGCLHETPYRIYPKCRSNHWRCSVKKSVLRNFAKFTGKHLCQRLFLNKVAGLRQLLSCEFCEISKPFLQNTSGRLLLEMRFQLIIKEILFTLIFIAGEWNELHFGGGSR